MHVLRGGAAFAVFVLTTVAGGAWATEVSIGGVSITLPAPAGFCELSADQPADNRALTMAGGRHEKEGNKLLGFFADCQQLADWRAGKRRGVDDYVQAHANIADMVQVVVSPKAAIHEACVKLRAEGEDFTSAGAPDIKSKIEGSLPNVKVNSLEFVGVLAEDDTACYAAGILKARLPNGADTTQLYLHAITVVKSKVIFVNRFAPYTSADATLGLLAKLRDTVAALHAANK